MGVLKGLGMISLALFGIFTILVLLGLCKASLDSAIEEHKMHKEKMKMIKDITKETNKQLLDKLNKTIGK